MIERIIFRPAAEYELKEAYKWYEQRDAGLGSDFLRSVEACLLKIRRYLRFFPLHIKMSGRDS